LAIEVGEVVGIIGVGQRKHGFEMSYGREGIGQVGRNPLSWRGWGNQVGVISFEGLELFEQLIVFEITDEGVILDIIFVLMESYDALELSHLLLNRCRFFAAQVLLRKLKKGFLFFLGV